MPDDSSERRLPRHAGSDGLRPLRDPDAAELDDDDDGQE